MKRLLYGPAVLALMAGPAWAGSCLSGDGIKQTAIINIGAATTTKIVDAVPVKNIHVCSFIASLAGTTPSITFLYGTHTSTDCDTGAVNLSGAILPTSGSVLALGYGDDIMTTPPNFQLCGTTTGTGSSFQGILTYVAR